MPSLDMIKNSTVEAGGLSTGAVKKAKIDNMFSKYRIGATAVSSAQSQMTTVPVCNHAYIDIDITQLVVDSASPRFPPILAGAASHHEELRAKTFYNWQCPKGI